MLGALAGTEGARRRGSTGRAAQSQATHAHAWGGGGFALVDADVTTHGRTPPSPATTAHGRCYPAAPQHLRSGPLAPHDSSSARRRRCTVSVLR